MVMTWPDFVNRFRADFTPVVEVQQLERELHDLHQTIETVVEFTT